MPQNPRREARYPIITEDGLKDHLREEVKFIDKKRVTGPGSIGTLCREGGEYRIRLKGRRGSFFAVREGDVVGIGRGYRPHKVHFS